jgi:hypothetical protein
MAKSDEVIAKIDADILAFVIANSEDMPSEVQGKLAARSYLLGLNGDAPAVEKPKRGRKPKPAAVDPEALKF